MHECGQRDADVTSADRAEADRPSVTQLLAKGVANAAGVESLDVSFGPFVSAGTLEGGVQAIAPVVHRPDRHLVRNGTSLGGEIGHGSRIGVPPPRLEQARTRRYGIPATKPAQTIADLRSCVPEKELRRAIRQASVLGLPLGPEINRDPTRSDLERDFLRLCRQYGLPVPEVNVWIGPREVDFLWRDANLVVETDGYRYHRGRQAFEDDRARDLDLRSRGFDVLRFSYRQVTAEPQRVAAVVRVALATD